MCRWLRWDGFRFKKRITEEREASSALRPWNERECIGSSTLSIDLNIFWKIIKDFCRRSWW